MFDKDLLNEIIEVQTVFDQMEAVVQQCSVDKQCSKIAKKELFLENDRLLQKIISQVVLLTVMNSMSLNGEYVNVEIQRTQLQDKDTTICKLKEIIKSMRENTKEENVNYDKSEIATNMELENIEQAKAQQPLNNALDFACKHAKRIQELLVYVRDTCPNAIKLSEKKVESSKTSDSNTPVLSSTGLKCSTSNCGSKPTGNKNNDRISQTPSRNMKNKVKAQPRKVNKKNHVVEPIRDVDVKHSPLNANSKLVCATCNKCMFDGIHDMCLVDFVKNVNSHAKSAKKHKKQNIWKPTGHVFTKVGFKWKPTGRTFILVGNPCPLTRITHTKVVPIKESTPSSVETSKPELKVYSRRPKNVNNIGSSKKAKIVKSNNANNLEPNHTWGSNATDIPSSSSLVNDRSSRLFSVRFRNDQIARIMGYDDYQLGNDTKVAFRKNTCFIWNLEGVDLLSGSKDTNLYTISLDDMLKASPICLLSKVSKKKTWLWQRQLSHLNFSTLNKLAKDGIARGILKLKFQKDHIFLRTKYEAPEAIINCIKNIQVRLNATIRNVQTDNGIEFVNQTLREFYENVGISHQISIARTPQQNGVLMHDKKPDLSFLHVFGSLCYPTTDNEDLGKLDAKADIGIFVGYAPAMKAFRIYNRRTGKIIETIHVTFDELTTMASEQFSSGPELHSMTPATSSS
ncbi:retrovirus-related pol polyprotein from transposon TNT 1-94 [Tanacetum coccineum]|uniref:Retrovirus-related pol polyprotein from transposon TNT 1-94 n=1 Tax=Tanacetum coccineum TaxID=301880 RepID=A0ABQ4Y0U4_9ASTR